MSVAELHVIAGGVPAPATEADVLATLATQTRRAADRLPPRSRRNAERLRRLAADIDRAAPTARGEEG